MNKVQLAAKVAEKAQIKKNQAEPLVEYVFEAIEETLAKGEEVNISGFGKFVIKETAARTARNLQTGEPIEVPAGKKPAFKAAKNLKESVKQ